MLLGIPTFAISTGNIQLINHKKSWIKGTVMETQKNAEMIVHVFQKYIEKFRIPTIYNPAAFFYPETCYHPKK